MNEIDSLDEILGRQCSELRVLESATILIKSKNAVSEELHKMRSDVSQLYKGISVMGQTLTKMKEQNDCLKKYQGLLESLDKKILHMVKNIPHQLICDYTAATMPDAASKSLSQVPLVGSENTIMEKDCKKKLFNEAKVSPMIPLFTMEEFNKVPKYIIGRLSLETANNFISCINEALTSKYKILALGKNQARKHGQLNLYLDYKKQEYGLCTDKEYQYFFTKEDYEKHAKTKWCKIHFNLSSALRHCKRIREYRGNNNDLKYVLIAKEFLEF